MKLWIDDERDPIIWTGETDWIWVKTAQHAIDYLDTRKITEVSFDHDLGETEDYDPNQNSGAVVASFIEECAYFGTPPQLKWNVHSANPVGRANIEAAMRAADQFWTKTYKGDDGDSNSF